MPVLHRRGIDVTLFACVLALVAIGLVMIYSASSIVANCLLIRFFSFPWFRLHGTSGG